MLLLLITPIAYQTFLLNFVNFCLFVQRLYSKNQGGPVIMLTVYTVLFLQHKQPLLSVWSSQWVLLQTTWFRYQLRPTNLWWHQHEHSSKTVAMLQNVCSVPQLGQHTTFKCISHRTDFMRSAALFTIQRLYYKLISNTVADITSVLTANHLTSNYRITEK